MEIFKKGDRVVYNEPNNVFWTGVTGTFDRYERGYGFFLIDPGFESKSEHYGPGTKGAGMEPKYFSLIAPKDPTDEELAAEYRRKSLETRQVRKILEDRGFKFMYQSLPYGKGIVDVDLIKITKTVTTTKEI